MDKGIAIIKALFEENIPYIETYLETHDVNECPDPLIPWKTFLHYAVEMFKEKSIRFLLNNGAHVNTQLFGYPPPMRLLMGNYYAVNDPERYSKILLDAGASLKYWTGDGMKSLLHHCSTHKYLLAKQLIDYGAEIESHMEDWKVHMIIEREAHKTKCATLLVGRSSAFYRDIVVLIVKHFWSMRFMESIPLENTWF